MSLLRMILLGTYLGGVLGLVLGVAIRLGLLYLGTPRGALIFSSACFLATLATGQIVAHLEKHKGQTQP